MNKKRLLLIILLLSLSVRLGLFFTKWSDLRHGSALDYGSAAIGLHQGRGLTIHPDERRNIDSLPNNHGGDYLDFYSPENRLNFTEFLPGPAIIMTILWKVIPFHNFASYIILQILLDSILIVLLYAVFAETGKSAFLFASVIMAFNLPAIKRTLMMGYDFWPQFAVIVSFIGLYHAIYKNRPYIFLLAGVLSGITVWFRSITSFLPFFLVFLIILYQKLKDRRPNRVILKNALLFILPVILLISSLSLFRYVQTGSIRPTRSTFWHSFFSGVAQFPNPYGIRSSDDEVWRLGQQLNPELEGMSLSEMYKMPDSPYEQTLMREASRFIKEYPHLFIRNILYRTVIMISPFLYRGGDFIPASLYGALIPFGIIALLLWFLGMNYLYRNLNLIFWVSASIYVYFFITFGWFYVVGRVILPFLFMNILVYIFGLMTIVEKYRKKRPAAIRAR